MQFPPRKYAHPGMEISAIELKLWEIRNQLEINIELMIQNCPVDDLTMKIFGHPIEIVTSHVFDRIDELEKMLQKLSSD